MGVELPRAIVDDKSFQYEFTNEGGVAGTIRLLTNNPKKVEGLRELGVNVSGRMPHVIPANEYNRFYLETKAARSGHLIDFDGHEHLLEQIDRPVVEGMDDEAIEAVGSLDAVEARA